MIAPPLAPALGVLDLVRGRLLGLFGPFTRTFIAPRERRIALMGGALLTVALATTLTFPLLLLVFGPLIWGVPHLVADIRYLVMRPGLHRRGVFYLAAAAWAVGAYFGLGVRAGLAAAAIALLGCGGSWLRRGIGLGVCGVLLALAQSSPWLADVIFVHAHNGIALVYWLAWRKRATKAHLWVVALFSVATALIFLGPSLAIAASTGGLDMQLSTLTVWSLGTMLSPSFDPGMTLRFALFFAFAQAAHYVVWLHLLPQEDSKKGAPLSFKQSWRSLGVDVGAPMLWLSLLVGVGLLVLATRSLSNARDVYLNIAFFHGHLELVAAAFLLSGRRAS